MSKEMRECRAKREIKSVPAKSRVTARQHKNTHQTVVWQVQGNSLANSPVGSTPRLPRPKDGRTTGAPAGRRIRPQCLR